jgi:PAS domain-containing protein
MKEVVRSERANPAQLQATLNVVPAYTWYAAPSGGLTFVNRRTADYLGLPEDHPLRFGVDIGARWDAHIRLLHPDDHEETRKVWSTCLRRGEAGEVSFRVRSARLPLVPQSRRTAPGQRRNFTAVGRAESGY